MSTLYSVPKLVRTYPHRTTQELAAAITWTSSKQTYYTVRLLADRDRAHNAFRAYAYFRWVDDQLDKGGMHAADRMAFVERQAALVERCYLGNWPQHLSEEEDLLVELVRSDREPDSGLQSYIRHMMAVMAFDAERRGRLISEVELSNYTHWLATAVTEALHHFIGHRCKAPRHGIRYLAAAGAHITHMLRDTVEDTEAGYINIPREAIESRGINPHDVQSSAYRDWVMHRVGLARNCFRAGRSYLSQVGSLRCRLAGYAYIARFESVLDDIVRDDYRLRRIYPECEALGTSIRVGCSMLTEAVFPYLSPTTPRRFSVVEG